MAHPPAQERRRKSRLRLPQTVRVRPSGPRRIDFDEILPTVNTSRDSVYFVSKNQAYEEGMRVFITCPYSDGPGSINRESLGKVVRIDELEHAQTTFDRCCFWSKPRGVRANGDAKTCV